MNQHQDPYNLLEQTMQLFTTKLSADEMSLFISLWKPYVAKRKEILSLPNKTDQYLYFVTEGVQRIYFDDGQRQATLLFTYALSFGGILDSFLLQKPSLYYYETLTKSTFLRASHTDIAHFMTHCSSFASLVRHAVTEELSGLLHRLVELQCYSSEERFKNLLRRSPHILQHIPQKYLANYIGVDPTNFSKMINTIKI